MTLRHSESTSNPTDHELPRRVRAYIGMGSNQGDRGITLRHAVDALGRLPDTTIAAQSSVYVTAPIDPCGEQPDYYNAVIAIDTMLSPRTLLASLQHIELDAGRTRQAGARNRARTLDLDILLYDALTIDEPGLHIPHPRLCDRAFVLRPLSEIAPECVIPGAGPVTRLLDRVADQRIDRLTAEPHRND